MGQRPFGVTFLSFRFAIVGRELVLDLHKNFLTLFGAWIFHICFHIGSIAYPFDESLLWLLFIKSAWWYTLLTEKAPLVVSCHIILSLPCDWLVGMLIIRFASSSQKVAWISLSFHHVPLSIIKLSTIASTGILFIRVWTLYLNGLGSHLSFHTLMLFLILTCHLDPWTTKFFGYKNTLLGIRWLTPFLSSQYVFILKILFH